MCNLNSLEQPELLISALDLNSLDSKCGLNLTLNSLDSVCGLNLTLNSLDSVCCLNLTLNSLDSKCCLNLTLNSLDSVCGLNLNLNSLYSVALSCGCHPLQQRCAHQATLHALTLPVGLEGVHS
jgi:hypothetical protein